MAAPPDADLPEPPVAVDDLPPSPVAPSTTEVASAPVSPPDPVVDDASVEPPAPPAPLTAAERGVPGASARAEGVRRSKKREERVRARHPKLGGLILAVSGDPTSTKVWEQGAVGEERIGAYLEEARSQGIEVLHDRRIPRSRANIDHLVVAPTGIWVVDPKRYLSGRLEPRVVGKRKEAELRPFVGRRDKTSLITGMRKQVDLVTAALTGTPFAEVPVHGALCFVGTELGFFVKPWEIQGIHVTWRKYLLRPMLAPGDDEPIGEPQRTAIARHLADHFKPA